MPDANAVHTGQTGRHLSQTRVGHQSFHPCMGLPEIDQLIEHLPVVFGVLVDAVVFAGLTFPAGHLLPAPLPYGLHDVRAPIFQFLRGKEVIDDKKAVLLIGSDLLVCQLIVHVMMDSYSGFQTLFPRFASGSTCSGSSSTAVSLVVEGYLKVQVPPRCQMSTGSLTT